MTVQEIIKYSGENIDLVQLIDCQQAEIDSLKADLKRVCAERDAHICTSNVMKSEAVKEFAETVKKNHLMLFNNIYSHKEFVDAVDRLVKEMVGEKE